MIDGAPRMIFLGFGKYVRADKIYALEPLGEGLRGHGARTRVWVDGIAEPIVASRTERRGHGARTRVWVDGIAEPIVASRTERAIITAMGGSPADSTRLLDEALDLAHRVADAAEQGRVDVVDLGRRARRVLASTSQPEAEGLF